MKFTRRVTRATLVTGIVVFNVILGAGATPTLLGSPLVGSGLPTDTPTLISYLTNGVPRDIHVDASTPHYPPSRIPMEQWNFYAAAVSLLESRKASEAAPALVRLMDEPLPRLLEEDLDLYVAMRWMQARSWENWDTQIAAETMKLRRHCGWALSRIDANGAGERVVRLIERYVPAIRKALQQPSGDQSLSGQFGSLCVEAAGRGRKEGIDALIALLPYTLNASGYNHISSYLVSAVGPRVVTAPDLSQAAQRDAVEEWRKWWAENREGLALPYKRPPAPPAAVIPYPPTDFRNTRNMVRSYVWASSQWKLGGDCRAVAHPEVGKWLEANAGKYAKLLRKLTEDTTESQEVRESAARWYLRKGGKPALAWLSRTVLGQGESDAKLRTSLGEGFLMSLLQETPGPETNDLARACVVELNSAAPLAVQFLLDAKSYTSNSEFILANYKALISRYPGLLNNIVSYYFYNPTPNAEVVFADGVEGSDQYAAEIAATAILRQNLEERLPDSARRSLAKWREDPLFKIGLVESIPAEYPADKAARRAQITQILHTVSGTDAHAAQVYARAYSTLANPYSDSESSLSPEANACLDSLRKCVAAYQDSRRQNPPQ